MNMYDQKVKLIKNINEREKIIGRLQHETFIGGERPGQSRFAKEHAMRNEAGRSVEAAQHAKLVRKARGRNAALGRIVGPAFGPLPGPTRSRGGLGKGLAGAPLDLHRFSTR